MNCVASIYGAYCELQIMERKANALVRLALFNEVKRLPLRREEINKKGM
jgi:hypothetical protein